MTTSARDRLSIFTQPLDEALADEKAVRAFSECLGRYMEKIHGVPMRVYIDHDLGLVLVRPI